MMMLPAQPGISHIKPNPTRPTQAKGDAVLFYSLHPDATTDAASLHGGCPVIRGEKWVATKWIHVGPFQGTPEAAKAAWGDCVDSNHDCAAWAAMGECQSNPDYMMYNCRASCGACRPSA